MVIRFFYRNDGQIVSELMNYCVLQDVNDERYRQGATY